MAELREIQLCELSILKAVTKICDKHHLIYYLSSGTLLGAIRHDGFIPWDDDVDIEMPVEDYRKFLRYASRELGNEFFLQTFVSDPGYHGMWAKVRKNGTTSMPVMCRGLDIHFGIGIDIFPITGIYQNPILKKIQYKCASLCRALLAKDYILETGCDTIQGNHKLELIYRLPRGLRIRLAQIFEHLVWKRMAGSESLSVIADDITYFMKAEYYQTDKTHVFEDTQFRIPGEYDSVLKSLYGDYMTPPPVSDRNWHQAILGNIIYDCNRNFTEFQE